MISQEYVTTKNEFEIIEKPTIENSKAIQKQNSKKVNMS